MLRVQTKTHCGVSSCDGFHPSTLKITDATSNWKRVASLNTYVLRETFTASLLSIEAVGLC
ncbi:MAG: hypothetical protein WAN65_13870 [Candidatus Sulfotelmatobacter sp.]